MTSTIKNYPFRIPITFNEKNGNIVLDQIRTIDKSRIIKKIGSIEQETQDKITEILLEMFG